MATNSYNKLQAIETQGRKKVYFTCPRSAIVRKKNRRKKILGRKFGDLIFFSPSLATLNSVMSKIVYLHEEIFGVLVSLSV